MRKVLLYCASALCLLLVMTMVSIAGPCSEDQEASTVFVPDRSCYDLGFGYQYQHFGVSNRTISNNGFNVDFGMRLGDLITGAAGRMTIGAEATGIFGFGTTGGVPNLNAKTFFAGIGPHVSIQSPSRFEPWAHLIPGVQGIGLTQTATFGHSTGFGFLLGGGLDTRIRPALYWRVQGDYIGTLLQSTYRNNYSAGTGLVLYF